MNAVASDSQRAEWVARQLELKQRLVTHDQFAWSLDAAEGEPLQLIGGVDISFEKDDEQGKAACAGVLHKARQ